MIPQSACHSLAASMAVGSHFVSHGFETVLVSTSACADAPGSARVDSRSRARCCSGVVMSPSGMGMNPGTESCSMQMEIVPKQNLVG